MSVMAFFRIVTALLAFIELSADQVAEFAFNNAIVLVSVLDDAFADFEILLEGLMTGINHHAGEALIDTILAQFERITVVKVYSNGNSQDADGCFNELLEIDWVRIPAGTFGNLKHHWRFFFFTSLHNGLQELHIVDVERPKGVLAFQGFRK